MQSLRCPQHPSCIATGALGSQSPAITSEVGAASRLRPSWGACPMDLTALVELRCSAIRSAIRATCAHRQPAIDAHCADQRQVIAPVQRPRLDQLTASRHPRVRAPHGQIRARFVEKDRGADRRGPASRGRHTAPLGLPDCLAPRGAGVFFEVLPGSPWVNRERCATIAPRRPGRRARCAAPSAPLDPASRSRAEALMASKLTLAGLPASVD